jgi:hypothetical protein
MCIDLRPPPENEKWRTVRSALDNWNRTARMCVIYPDSQRSRWSLGVADQALSGWVPSAPRHPSPLPNKT